jgi:hypothetical protein
MEAPDGVRAERGARFEAIKLWPCIWHNDSCCGLNVRTESDEHMELSEMRDQVADFETRTEKLGRRL